MERRYPCRQEFYKDPRNGRLRDLCIQVLDLIKNLASNPAHTVFGDSSTSLARLEHLDGELIGEGIQLKMHLHRPAEDYRNPKLMVEYCASFLRGAISKVFVPGLRVESDVSVGISFEAAEIPMPTFTILPTELNACIVWLDASGEVTLE